MAQVLGGTGIWIGFAIAYFNKTPAQDSWAIIHFLQLILVLPLMVISINTKVKDFILSNWFTTLLLYILPMNIVKSIPVIKEISFHQPDQYLRRMGWASGSTLANNFVPLTIVSVIGIIHLMLYLTRNINHKYSALAMRVYNFFAFTIYIWIAIRLYHKTRLLWLLE